MNEISKRLVEVVKHVALGTKPYGIAPLRNVLLTERKGHQVAVAIDRHRMAIAEARADGTLDSDQMVSVMAKAEDMPATAFPDWKGAWVKLAPGEGLAVVVDRQTLLSALIRTVVQAEQSMDELGLVPNYGSSGFCERFDIKRFPLDNGVSECHVAIEVEPHGKTMRVGLLVGSPRKSYFKHFKASEMVLANYSGLYCFTWWYLVQALTFAASDGVVLRLRSAPLASEVCSFDDWVNTTEIIMPLGYFADDDQAVLQSSVPVMV